MRKIVGIATGILMQLSVVSQQVEIREPVRFLALGDSYTIGQSVADSLSWPRQLYDSLEAEGFTLEELQIIARTGWRTDNLAAAIYDARLREDYNLVSLLIGVNDQYQGVPIENYPAAFTGLLEEAIELAEGRTSGVFVLSIPDYAYTPVGGGNQYISDAIDAYNEINRSIAADYQVKYFDITPLSRQGLEQPGLVAADGLHPSGAMYGLWVTEIMQHLRLNNSPGHPDYLTQYRSRDLRVYPNPGNGLYYLDLSDCNLEDPVLLNLYSDKGILVRQEKISDKLQTLDIGGFPPGIYYLEVTAGQLHRTGHILHGIR